LAIRPTLLVPSLTAALAALALSTDAGAQRRNREAAAPQKLEHLTYEQERFDSPALGGARSTYGVFLPVGYEDEENAATRYPLVIWLHGMWEDHDRFLQRGGAQVLDQMVGSGSIPPLVLVCANGDRSSFWTNAPRAGAAFEDLVTKDLLSHLEATYRIRTDRAGRAITGVSMGGYGAMKIALKDPSRFGVVATHSAAILPPELDRLVEEFPFVSGRGAALLAAIFGDPVDEERYRAENVLALAASIDPERLAGLKIYFDCGDQDRYGFHRTNQALHDLLDAREIPHVWRLVEGGGHSWGAGFTQEALTHSLRFVAQAFAAESAKAGLGGLLAPGVETAETGRPAEPIPPERKR
jgi:S-formylglutathione hydrolase FrmB